MHNNKFIDVCWFVSAFGPVVVVPLVLTGYLPLAIGACGIQAIAFGVLLGYGIRAAE